MKKLFATLIITLVVFSLQAQNIGNYLLAFESNIKAEAFSAQWKNYSADWQTQCKPDANVSTTLLLMARMEANLNRDALSADWESKRGDWLRDLKTANNEGALAKLLMQLEANLKPTALSDRWADYKPQWSQALQVLQK